MTTARTAVTRDPTLHLGRAATPSIRPADSLLRSSSAAIAGYPESATSTSVRIANVGHNHHCSTRRVLSATNGTPYKRSHIQIHCTAEILVLGVASVLQVCLATRIPYSQFRIRDD